MSAALQVDVHLGENNVWHIRLAGEADDRSQFVPIAANASGATVIIDGAELQRINSLSVARWVAWMAALEGRNNQVYLVRASRALLLQCYYVVDFMGQRGILASIHVPFDCAKCTHTEWVHLVLGDLDPDAALPTQACPRCGSILSANEIEEPLVNALRTLPTGPLPPAVREAILRPRPHPPSR